MSHLFDAPIENRPYCHHTMDGTFSVTPPYSQWHHILRRYESYLRLISTLNVLSTRLNSLLICLISTVIVNEIIV